jgi:hypothetical protein
MRLGAVSLCLLAQTALAAEPPANYGDWATAREIFVPMRDGVNLSTDVLMPKARPAKLPAILIRTPYDKEFLEWGLGGWSWHTQFLKHGYALVFQNERGHQFSEGSYDHYLQGARTDGYDTIDWIVKQNWSNGKVATFGCSSSAEQQWPLAASHHPAHLAMLPAASGTAIGNVGDNHTQGTIFRGGIPMTGLWAWWYSDMVPTERLILPPHSTEDQRIRLHAGYTADPQRFFFPNPGRTIDLEHPSPKFAEMSSHLPSKDILRVLGVPLTPFDQFITWGPADPRWSQVELYNGEALTIPALHLDTWHDVGISEMVKNFAYLQDKNTPNQYLVVGAGEHCSMTESAALPRAADYSLDGFHIGGDARYGASDTGYVDLAIKWFDAWLKGEKNAIADMPHVQLLVMGKGWMSGDRWPLPQTRFSTYYLGSDGNAASRLGSGVLTTEPQSGAASDTYLYDPMNPTPSMGGACCSLTVQDQSQVEMRKDVLVYSTPVLKTGVAIAGPVEAVLYVSSSARDTDFMVKLVDVFPDGKAMNLVEDAFRARYRNGFDRNDPMQPGEVYKLKFNNMAMGNYFAPGHRIRVEVSSSSSPTFERNLNTGGRNYDEVTGVTALNTIHHDAAHASYISLPVIPDESQHKE